MLLLLLAMVAVASFPNTAHILCYLWLLIPTDLCKVICQSNSSNIAEAKVKYVTRLIHVRYTYTHTHTQRGDQWLLPHWLAGLDSFVTERASRLYPGRRFFYLNLLPFNCCPPPVHGDLNQRGTCSFLYLYEYVCMCIANQYKRLYVQLCTYVYMCL